MGRRPHPHFKQDNQWLQSFEDWEASNFEEMLHLLGIFSGYALPKREGDSLILLISRSPFSFFRQTKEEFLKNSWVNTINHTNVDSEMESLQNQIEELGSRIQQFNREEEIRLLDTFALQQQEITIYPADQDFLMAMPEPRVFFEAAELKGNQVVLDTRSSMVLECGADSLWRGEKFTRPKKVATSQVIEAGLWLHK